MAKRGENIHKRKDGRWEGRYKSGTNDYGKTVYSSVYGKTYTDVKNKLIDIISKKEITANVKEHTLAEIIYLWRNATNRNCKGSTKLKYDYLIEKHIIPCLGSCKISCINSFILNDYVNHKLSNGRVDKKGGLSPSYVKSMVTVISSAIKFAVDEQLSNPVSLNNCKINSDDRTINILGIAEQNKLEQFLLKNTDKTKLGILISLRTGLRIGEICALKWSDIDFINRVFHIQSTVSRVKRNDKIGSELIIDKPKTKSSLRDIPIPSDLFQKLISMSQASDSEFVVSENDNFISPRTYEYRYHKVLKSCGLRSINYHTLRHTFATRCIELGVDVKTLSELLGHSNVNITLNTYVHSSMEHKRIQIEKLSGLSA